MKERLVELCDNIITSCKSSLCADCECNNIDYPSCMSVHFADEILADGWFRPPCKVGDKVYVVSRYYAGDWEIYECKIDSITIYEKNTFISCVANDVRFGKINFGLNISEIGKTLFLTREEAQAKLKEGGEE